MTFPRQIAVVAVVACVVSVLVPMAVHTQKKTGVTDLTKPIDLSLPSESVDWTKIAPLPGEKGGVDVAGPYQVADWPQELHQDYSWGHTDGVWAETPDRVFVIQQSELPRLEHRTGYGGVPIRRSTGNTDFRKDEHVLMIFDRKGKLVDTWKQHNDLFVHAHSLKMNPYDPQHHLWVIDDGAERVYKFTNDGKLVMALGEFKVSANDKTHFGGPTDIAFLPNGDFYISDGYKNSRIVKFSKDGKYLMEWGRKGLGPGEFILPHSIALDARQRIYVADRRNSRIQVFDLNGKHLDTWPNIPKATYIAISQDQKLWAVDCFVNKVLKYELDGKLLYSWGTLGGFEGGLWCTHQFHVDTEGNFYTAEVYGGRPQKFVPRPGADKSHLIGPLWDGK